MVIDAATVAAILLHERQCMDVLSTHLASGQRNEEQRQRLILRWETANRLAVLALMRVTGGSSDVIHG